MAGYCGRKTEKGRIPKGRISEMKPLNCAKRSDRMHDKIPYGQNAAQTKCHPRKRTK